MHELSYKQGPANLRFTASSEVRIAGVQHASMPEVELGCRLRCYSDFWARKRPMASTATHSMMA
jgi:hypothetical protein